MPLKTVPFDAAEILDDPLSQAELLDDAFATGDAAYIANALGVVARARGMTSVAKDAAKPETAPTLESLFAGDIEIKDLTYPLNAESPYWPAENYIPFSLKTIATLKEDGVLSKAFTSPEHLGTHIDAPNHFEANQPSVDEIPPTSCVLKRTTQRL